MTTTTTTTTTMTETEARKILVRLSTLLPVAIDVARTAIAVVRAAELAHPTPWVESEYESARAESARVDAELAAIETTYPDLAHAAHRLGGGEEAYILLGEEAHGGHVVPGALLAAASASDLAHADVEAEDS